MRTLLLVAAAVLALSTPVTAAFDGNYLHEQCEGYQNTASNMDNAARWSWCLGFISGVFDTNFVNYTLARMDRRAGLETTNDWWCVDHPKNPSYAQLTAVVLKYLEDNPAQRHDDAHILVTRAFKAAWPCK